jgi:archaemetzincin
MIRIKKTVIVSMLCIALISCNKSQSNNKIIVIQPFEDISKSQINSLEEYLRGFNSNIVIKKPIKIPNSFYVKDRNRYRADSIIRYLKTINGNDSITVGITNWDISTTKGKVSDWGVMGLGYRPGKSCVISTFRLNKKNLTEQFHKVVLHEIGHTIGLKHCQVQTCLMRDAEGGNPLDQEKDFCLNCKKVLINSGFKIP